MRHCSHPAVNFKVNAHMIDIINQLTIFESVDIIQIV